MSRPVAIVLDVARLRAVTDASDGSVLEMPWDPTVPADALTRLRDMFGAPSAVLLIVGVGFLEIARPELPPLASDARHALLMRDADRYFPTSVQAAAAWSDGLAFAMPALTLDSWVRAFSELGPIDGVITIPEACAEAFDDCVVATDGGHGEHATIEVHRGTVRAVRRVNSEITQPPGSFPTGVPLNVGLLARAALAQRNRAPHAQLLDASLLAYVTQRRQRRVWRSIAAFTTAAVMLAWSANVWRERTFQSVSQQLRTLSSTAFPARQAMLRLERATAEYGQLEMADSVARNGMGPAAMLAQLSAVLPADAFVQRLEWDGALWRIDGSATDAPRIVPLLDADAHFTDVRILAASTRFLDAGRQRESFSIAFRARDVRGSVRASR